MNIAVAIKSSYGKTLWPLAITLILSAFTHLWNPIGFPTPHGDEAHYMRRAMHVLDGLGPQETPWSDRPFDHPYFGQIFLAAALGIVGYPDSLHPSTNLESIEKLSLLPRVSMGLLAVLDTFLIYKIGERRYNKNVALIAAILFAVMPSTWFVRRILLDSILLPFLLLSILFAISSRTKINVRDANCREEYSVEANRGKNGTGILVILISGIFLGLTIFTKIPSISMAPLVGYLIFTSNNRKWKRLGIWLIPVIVIPLIWPSYSLINGDLHRWTNDVFWQAGRQGSGLWSLHSIFQIDPVLTSLGIMGIIFAAIKRDYLPIFWTIPFMLFIEYIGFTQNFHWSMVLPAFCIAGSALMATLIKKINNAFLNRGDTESPTQTTIEEHLPESSILGKRSHNFSSLKASSHKVLLGIVLVGIGIFGLVSTTMLITSNLDSQYFALYSFIMQQLPRYDQDSANHNNMVNKVTVIGDKRWVAEFLWIPRYVFDYVHDFRGNFRTLDLSLKEPIESEKVLLIVDSRLMEEISRDSSEVHIRQLKEIYNETRTIGTFEDSEEYEKVRSQRDTYPFTSMGENRGTGKIEVRTNY